VPNDNFDTGEPDPPGAYFMNDNVRAKLLEKLAEENFAGVTPELREDFLKFYSNPDAPFATKNKPKDWSKLQVALQQLKTFTPAPVTAESLADQP
jgi:hypothetical protein